ncbi:MAG: insulinase family protein [Pseudomonadota bacterium]
MTELLHRSLFTLLVVVGLQLALIVPAGAEIRTSPNDHRAYRNLVLDNGLRVLMVSDPRADKSAASLDVYIGSGADPTDRPGLAHFLEHMLFLGTEKYPKAGDYQSFITANGGRHNAYTSHEHTNYFFDIENSAFEGALDRFGQFFIAPLFSAEYVQREKHAVHSEYQASTKSDSRRIWEARQAMMNPAHPASQFSIGSLDTLADRPGSTIRDELLAFYERYYSANLMALTVLSPRSLDEQETLVRSIFSKVKNSDATLPDVTASLFAPGALPARLEVLPVKDARRVSLVFPVPPLHAHYRSKPTAYLANLIGHEGKGSLLSALLASGWSDGLSAGAGRSARDSATFQISIKLTRDGLDHVDDVVAMVFSYIDQVRASPPEEWRFDEQAQIADIAFRFQERRAPIHYVTGLSNAQHTTPIEDIVYGGYRMDAFDPALITSYLEYLRPANMLLIVTAKGLSVDDKTRYFQTEYRKRAISNETLARWEDPAVDARLQLPERNVFVPDSLALKAAGDVEKPVALLERSGFTVWYQPDGSFGVPRANFFVSLRSPVANRTARELVVLKLFVRAVNESLKEFAYPVQLAGLGYDLYQHMRGVTIRISGYDAKQSELLTKVVEAMTSFDLPASRFGDFADDLERGLANRAKDRPSHQASRRVTDLLMTPRWSDQEQLAALKTVTREDVMHFAEGFLKDLEVVALAHGNLRPADALRLAGIVERELVNRAGKADVPRGRLVRLSSGDRFVAETPVDHDDSATIVYYQGRERTFAERAQFELLSQIISSPFYEQLRTEEQLGYVVYASSFPMFEVPGLAFVVQSPSRSPTYLRSRIDAFLGGFGERLSQMSSEEFEAHRQGLLSRVLEKDKNLGGRSQRYWNEIDRERFNFDSRTRLADAIRTVTPEALGAFYRTQILGDEQRKIVSLAPGNEFRSEPSVIADQERLLKDGAKLSGTRTLFPEVSTN